MEIVNRDNSRSIVYRDVFSDVDFDVLKGEIDWQVEKVLVYGKWHEPYRLRSGQGESSYSYSGNVVEGLTWSTTVKSIKAELEHLYGAKVSYVLCNYYPDGTSHLGYHSDNEKDLAPNASIYSVSFGASRKFYLKHTDGTRYDTVLNHGDVLIMEGETQRHFKHTVPKEMKVKLPRINLTFRLMK